MLFHCEGYLGCYQQMCSRLVYCTCVHILHLLLGSCLCVARFPMCSRPMHSNVAINKPADPNEDHRCLLRTLIWLQVIEEFMSIADGQLVLLAPDQQQPAAEQQLTRQNVDAQVSMQPTCMTLLASDKLRSKQAAAWHASYEVTACRGAARGSAAGHLPLPWQSWRPRSD